MQCRWPGPQPTASDTTAGTPQARFYTRWLTLAATRGEARVCELVVVESGQVIAADLCVVRDGTLVLLKIAYDEAHERYSPSSLLRREFLADVFSQPAVRRIEFFGRLMDWHRRWTSDHRRLYHLTHYRWAWLRKLRGASGRA